jgi:two-component system, LytTR family, response regulator
MEKIKVLIVDDEKASRDTLAGVLEKEHPEVYLAGQATGVEDAWQQIAVLKPDLVFLDIKMADGSGFDLLNRFEQAEFRVIFVTAYDDFTLDAIRFSAFDYLLKPINSHELREALDRFRKSLAGPDNLNVRMKAFINNYNADEAGRKKIVLKTADSIYLVPISTIIRCEAYNNYSWVYFSDQPKLLISKPLKHFEEMLGHYGFMRVHQSHLVNLSHLVRINKVDGGMVVLSDNIPVPISTRKREQVFRILQNL